MIPFDPRIVPIRLDVAARVLEGQVQAARFADPHVCQVRVPTAMMRKAPDHESEAVSQLLFGEPFDAYEESDGWVWGQCKVDDYVGYVRADCFSTNPIAPTHRVKVARTLAFSRPSIKSPPRMALPFNARLTVSGYEDRFLFVPNTGWVVDTHVMPIGSTLRDPASVAELFQGAVYLWGGREPTGCDCSGLVQAALLACGMACPRDTDMQEDTLGRQVYYGPDYTGLERNDLVFWKGHVGMMLDATTLIHANAHFMGVTIEPLIIAVQRIERTSGPVTSVRRLG